jgi:hypothetical protein
LSWQRLYAAPHAQLRGRSVNEDLAGLPKSKTDESADGAVVRTSLLPRAFLYLAQEVPDGLALHGMLRQLLALFSEVRSILLVARAPPPAWWSLVGVLLKLL